MKSKIIILLLAILLLTACTTPKNRLKDYLRNNDYEGVVECFQKTNKSEIVKFCLEECKVYMTDTELDDYFTIDLKNKKVEYIYDYMTYKYDIKKDEKICLFRGEEIDNNSSYCINAWKAFEIHYRLFNNELKKSKVKINDLCK